MPFGWTLVRKSELNELRAGWAVRNKVVECHRWFSGWKDLDIIWDYLLQPTHFGGIWDVRDRYAGSRGTDRYGNKSETV